jgi:SHS2 domain-containing protein
MSQATVAERRESSLAEHHWQHFSHDGDLGIRGFGDTCAEAFCQAALAMVSSVTDPDSIEPSQKVEVTLEAPDHERLLVDWLNALIREMTTRDMLFSRFDVSIEGSRLHASAWGEQLEVAEARPAAQLKRATATHLRVTQRPNGDWVAECVIDVSRNPR